MQELEIKELKQILDKLVEKYETPDFIPDDPIAFAHDFKMREDIEIVAFIASLFAYGNRKVFTARLKLLFQKIGESPLAFIQKGDFNDEFYQHFDYRFSKGVDLIQIFEILHILYEKSSLMELFEYGYKREKSVFGMFQIVVDYFYSRVTLPVTKGFFHLLPNPQNKSAMKRMCMFLRWMVRGGCVDFGVWDFLPKSKLLVPLDVHVARISEQLGLISKSAKGYTALMELSDNLLKLDKNDPAKYDFALFGFGIEHKHI